MTSPETYVQMVQRLVKWGPNFPHDFHHAATGICGEAIEFAFATGREHAAEELGDMEFYIRHAWLALEKWKILISTVHLDGAGAGEYEGGIESHSTEDALVKVGGDILDFSKKIWIYGKPPQALPLVGALLTFERLLRKACSDHGLTRVAAQDANQYKLSTGPNARYPLGYSDAAAIARADKPEGE